MSMPRRPGRNVAQDGVSSSKTQVALRNGLPAGLRPRPAEFTAADRLRGTAKVLPGLRRSTLSAAGECAAASSRSGLLRAQLPANAARYERDRADLDTHHVMVAPSALALCEGGVLSVI
jgi:hypothetical protein